MKCSFSPRRVFRNVFKDVSEQGSSPPTSMFEHEEAIAVNKSDSLLPTGGFNQSILSYTHVKVQSSKCMAHQTFVKPFNLHTLPYPSSYSFLYLSHSLQHLVSSPFISSFPHYLFSLYHHMHLSSPPCPHFTPAEPIFLPSPVPHHQPSCLSCSFLTHTNPHILLLSLYYHYTHTVLVFH